MSAELKKARSFLDLCKSRMENGSPTNRELAEQAVNDVYKRVKKREPEIIFWCDSPYQMAVIPPLAASIIENRLWHQLTQRLAAYDCQSGKWDELFEEEWQGIETKLGYLIKKVIDHPREYKLEQAVKTNALKRLKQLLRDALKKGKIRSRLIDCHHPNNTPVGFMNIKVDNQFLNYMRTVQVQVECEAALPLAIDLPVAEGPQEENLRSVTRHLQTTVSAFRAFSAMQHGVIDRRFVNQVVPQAEAILKMRHDETTLAKAAELKASCRELENISARALLWYRALPPIWSRLTGMNMWQEFFGNQWTDRTKDQGQSKFTRTLTGVQVGIDGIDKLKDAIHEDFGFRNHATLWFPHCASWIYFASACRFIKSDFFDSLQDDIDCFSALSNGAAGYVFCKNVCFACEKPTSFSADAMVRPHNGNGPAAAWSDRFEVYSWHGLPIEADLIKNRAGITVGAIHQEKNAEVKRVLIDLYGPSRYLVDANAKVVHQDECGTLFRMEIEGDEALVMVRVRNSTREPDGTYKHYFLRVPPTILKARDAVAWTFGLSPEEYNPKRES